ncbi:NRDE family protein [Zoogloea sp.]|uniref:NRDE family protein n=1 Tax=Zoogloea sp. TaxID=49181 RepID=UPI0035B14C14
MCLILAAWGQHPEFPLIIAANRDEYFARPAAPLGWWPAPAGQASSTPAILAGRDLEAGGTWMGFGADGSMAALTNFRDPARLRPEAPSRGRLVPDFITQPGDTRARLAHCARQAEGCNPFNLLGWDGQQLGILESETPSDPLRLLAPGIHGLSNRLLNTPWPKLTRAKAGLAALLPQLSADVLGTAPLTALLHDDRPAPDAELPKTGVPLGWERMLSSLFIRAPGYGTRCTTVALLDQAGTWQIHETTWNACGQWAGRVSMRIPPARL